MENASKALIMAASILLGVMILSVGVALFNSFAGFSSEIASEIEKKRTEQFNVQFLKYYGETYNEKTQKNEAIKLTTHDVVTLANLAQKNNIEYDVQKQTMSSDNSYYVQIVVIEDKNFEKSSEHKLTQFIKDNNWYYNSDNELVTKYYYISDIEVSKKTGRVIYVDIQEIKTKK